MFLPKIQRARIILGCVRAMLRNADGARKYKAGDMQSCKVDGSWNATITRGSDAADEPIAELPRDQWDLLHIHSEGELKLALRFHDSNVEIIVYVPGTWERWFTTFDLSDTEIIRPTRAA